ncbi:NACHT, LRR and PYD domains-containing protein 1 homolog isoform X2 [Alosa sapidissima]|uniref:NACHT, LRR and PYD domains-containing protein 1 homolog isoform X2 n=1 Tax=Alosa sapidissima TaxID=34773 RepID=UPI001C088A31|nr:NACHT, LRR and PYD domains-containing protein 1 homolog isoform X2 [Alosa sapidissima]
MASNRHGVQFVDEHRTELIQRVTNVMPLADELHSNGMLHNETYNNIRAERNREEKMRLIFDAVSGVDKKKYFLYTLLQKIEPHLMKELVSPLSENNTGTHMKRLLPSTSGASSEIQEKRGRFPGQNISEYKETLRTKYDTFEEYNSLPGEEVPLTDRYTKLLIVQRHRKKEEKEQELRSRGQEHSEVLSSRCGKDGSSTSVEQLFHPDDRGRIPKAVILQGDAGYGKSFTVQKIVYDWACGNLFQGQFELVLHLKCKELNLLSGEKNVMQLLDCSSEFAPVIEEMLSNTPQKVLFIIDGFDELKFSLDDNTTSPTDAFTPAPVEATLSALLKGRILHNSFLIVTTRSTASDKLSKLLQGPKSFTEILGFSETAVMEYFQRFFTDTQLYDEAYKYVKADIMLSTVCSIPVICWIVCTTFREHFEDSKGNMKGLETTTSIFLHFVSLLLKHHCQGLNQPAITLLRSLAKLAERGILKKQVLLEEKCVWEASSDPTSVPFLCKFLRKKKTGVETMFSFMHLSFQEFFTALHYLITDDEEARKKLENRLPYGHHTFTDKPDELKRSNMYYIDFLPVVEFLFGLSNSEATKFIMQHYNISVSPTIRACLETWIQEIFDNKNDLNCNANLDQFILACLYELHDEQFVEKVIRSWGLIDLSNYFVHDMTCWMLKYCILCCPRIKGLDISVDTAEKLKILQPALPRCEQLRLRLCNLEDADVDSLISVLEDKTVVTKIRIMGSSLSEQSFQKILTEVSNQHSLQHISLSVQTITSTVVATFLQFIQKKEIDKAELKSCDKDSCCSSLSIQRDKEGNRSYRFTLCGLEDDGVDGWISALDETTLVTELTIMGSSLSEQSFQKILTEVSNQHLLQHISLSVKTITSTVVATFLQFIQKKEIDKAELKSCDKDSCCSSLSIQRDKEGNRSYRIIAGYFHHPEIIKMIIVPSWGLPSYEKTPMEPDPALSLSFSESTETSGADWVGILQRFHTLKRLTQSPEFPGEMEALLSSLGSTPHLTELTLEVTCLNMSWAVWTLSLLHTCPGLAVIRMIEQICGDEQSVCSCISIEKIEDEIASRGLYTLSFRNFTAHSDVIFKDSTPPPDPALNTITLMLPQSSEMSSFDWKDILLKLHPMKNNKENPTLDEHQGALLTFLHSLPIQKLLIEVPCLTDTWAQGIVSLIEMCLSIKQLRLGEGTGWWWPCGFLLESGVQLLKNSKIRSDCTLLVKGLRCKKTTDQCTDNKNNRRCNRRITITIEGEAVQEDWPDLFDYEFSDDFVDDSDDYNCDDYYSDDEVSDWDTEDNTMARPPEDEKGGDEDAG